MDIHIPAQHTGRLVGFPPVISGSPHSLILGSMPGVASLNAQRYYAHPRNAFWPVVSELLGFAGSLSYHQRLLQLQARGYALWDVVKYCQRPGSLDSAIAADSVEANDFAALFEQYPTIHRVFLNGGAAAKLWRKHVPPELQQLVSAAQLPSTSPAYAAMPVSQKNALWQQIVL